MEGSLSLPGGQGARGRSQIESLCSLSLTHTNTEIEMNYCNVMKLLIVKNMSSSYFE